MNTEKKALEAVHKMNNRIAVSMFFDAEDIKCYPVDYENSGNITVGQVKIDPSKIDPLLLKLIRKKKVDQAIVRDDRLVFLNKNVDLKKPVVVFKSKTALLAIKSYQRPLLKMDEKICLVGKQMKENGYSLKSFKVAPLTISLTYANKSGNEQTKKINA